MLALAAAALVAPAAAHAAGFHSLASDALIEQVHQTHNDTDLVLLQTQASVSAQRVQGYCEICVRMIQMKQRFQPDVCSGLTDNFFITVSLPSAAATGARGACWRARAVTAVEAGAPCAWPAQCSGCHCRCLCAPPPSPWRDPCLSPPPALRCRPAQCVKNLESIIKADRAVSYWHNVGCVHLDAAGPEAVKPCPAHVICGWTPNIFGQRIRADGETMGQLAPLCPRDTNFVPRVPRTDAPAELPFDFSKLSK